MADALIEGVKDLFKSMRAAGAQEGDTDMLLAAVPGLLVAEFHNQGAASGLRVLDDGTLYVHGGFSIGGNLLSGERGAERFAQQMKYLVEGAIKAGLESGGTTIPVMNVTYENNIYTVKMDAFHAR